MDEAELRGIRRAARRQQLTVSEWVRRTLRTARESQEGTGRGHEARGHPSRGGPLVSDCGRRADAGRDRAGLRRTLVILVDSNVPMYLVGAEHPLKFEARRLLEAAVASRERLVTDAEVLQEILHRYVGDRPA